MRDRTRRALPRVAVVLGGVLLLGALSIGAWASAASGAAAAERLIAPATPLGAVLEALRSVTGRAVVTGVAAVLAGCAAVLAWRPAREDVTALLLERWAVLAPPDELDAPASGAPAAEEPSAGPRVPALHGS